MKLAVFLPNWIGDVVMATPALRALRRLHPNARILGVVKPYVADVLAGTDWIDEYIPLDSKGPGAQRWWGASRRLRAERIDLAILFPNTFRSAWVAYIAGCRHRVGYRRYCRDLLLTEAVSPIRDARGKLRPSPVIDAYNLLVERVGCPNPGVRMELSTLGRDEAAADEVWRDGGLDSYRDVVCLNPGAAFGSSKHWPQSSFAELARRLTDDPDRAVLILCGPTERDMARSIAEEAGRPSVQSLAGRSLSLGLTKACVRRASLLVTTDSGPRHFAAAFDRPVLTLFGPTHIEWTETYFAKARHLQKKVDCGPCQRRACPLDHRCMTGLGVVEVYEAALNLLSRFPCPTPRQVAVAGG